MSRPVIALTQSFVELSRAHEHLDLYNESMTDEPHHPQTYPVFMEID
jgi:hypothetical protein